MIQLSKPQTAVWDGEARFKVLVCGRRFGKTFLALSWLLYRALSSGGLNYYIAPTYGAAKSIAWRELKRMVESQKIIKNESELYVEFRNGGIIQLRGAENRDALRGVSLSSAVLDEFAFMDQEVWTEVVRPATSDRLAPVLFITSPSGWNWAKELYDFAQNPENESWQAWTFTTAQGGIVPESEIEAAKNELPEKTFKQEYLASFESLSNRCYYNFEPTIHVTKDLARVEDAKELYVGIDFNVDPICAVIGIKAADQLHIVDEAVIPNSNTTDLAKEIRHRYPRHILRAYPDPSGKARKTSAGGATDFTILQQGGFRVLAPKAAPAVADRINEVNALLTNAKGVHRMYVHPKCKELIRGLSGQTYKQGTSIPDKNLGLDHIVDALGYLVHMEYPIVRPFIGPTNIRMVN